MGNVLEHLPDVKEEEGLFADLNEKQEQRNNVSIELNGTEVVLLNPSRKLREQADNAETLATSIAKTIGVTSKSHAYEITLVPPVEDLWYDDGAIRVAISCGVIRYSKEIISKKDGGLQEIETVDEKNSIYPILPVAQYRVQENGVTENYVRLRYLTTDFKIQEKTINVRELGNLTKVELPGFNPPPNTTISKLSNTLSELLRNRTLAKTIKVYDGAAEVGWYDGDYITASDPRYSGTAPITTSTKGERILWEKAAVAMMEASPMAALAVAAAIGGFCRGAVYTPTESSLFILIGAAMKGKSTILRLAASFVGMADKAGAGGGVLLEGISTKIGVEQYMVACNHGFLCMDEIDDLFSRPDPVGDLMYYSNGGGRAKSSKDGTLKSNGKWNASMLLTANGNIQTMVEDRKSNKGEAFGSRSVQLDILDPEITTFSKESEGTILKLTNIIKENYGWGHADIIAYIKKYRKLLVQVADHKHSVLMKQGIESRQTDTLVLMFLGASILKDMFNNDVVTGNVMTAWDILRQRMAEGVAERKTNKGRNLRRDFLWEVYNNHARFTHKGYAHDPNTPRSESAGKMWAIECTKNAQRQGTLLGCIFQREVMENELGWTGEVAINSTGKTLFEKNNFPFDEVVNLAKKEGWFIAPTSEKRADKRYGIAAAELVGAPRAYTFDMSKLQALLQQEDDLANCEEPANIQAIDLETPPEIEEYNEIPIEF